MSDRFEKRKNKILKKMEEKSILDSGPLDDVGIATQFTFTKDEVRVSKYTLEVKAINKPAAKLKTRLWIRMRHKTAPDFASLKELEKVDRKTNPVFRDSQIRRGKERYEAEVEIQATL